MCVNRYPAAQQGNAARGQNKRRKTAPHRSPAAWRWSVTTQLQRLSFPLSLPPGRFPGVPSHTGRGERSVGPLPLSPCRLGRDRRFSSAVLLLKRTSFLLYHLFGWVTSSRGRPNFSTEKKHQSKPPACAGLSELLPNRPPILLWRIPHHAPRTTHPTSNIQHHHGS